MTLSDRGGAVVQDAWERIRKESFEQTRAEEDASCDDIAELAKRTQAQLNNIARECSDSVLRLRSSMSGDVDVLRREVETVQGQLDALKQDLASQLHELSTAAITPGILAAAIAAMEQHTNQYLPTRSIVLHDTARSRVSFDRRVDAEREERERKLDALHVQIARLSRTNGEAS